ncbi:hypothetical protein FYK55_19790 [Roseiconus nitratireducens]|uniref:Uncharacterized protein n=1 Tax=Roseiconus nitratireducens TaxID=2605748 RepID=A0A5M6D4G2_9BACT|nr:hypothetical protein [Roseiconus nitratireducens]KAA5540639.1 hypothetical protein FYK55_19790 [Roseiconus nitratireducens]
MSADPFPDDPANPFSASASQRRQDPAINPYAPTAEVSESEGFESDADAFRRRYLNHEASIQSVGSLYVLGGALFTLMFVVVAVSMLAAVVNGQLEGEAIAVLLIYGALGVVQLYAGLGLRKFRTGARSIVAIFSALGLLAFPFGTLINGYILYLLLGRKGNVVFSPEYQEVRERTPHIKYKTPVVVKIFVVLLVLVVITGFLMMFLGV